MQRVIRYRLPAALVLAVLSVLAAQAAGPRSRVVAATQPFSLSLECTPSAVESGEEVTCTANAYFDTASLPVSYTWTPTGEGSSDTGRTFRFDGAGDKTVVVRACLTDADGRPIDDCQRETAHVLVDGAPIEGLRCDPPRINDRQSTTCTIAFALERAEISWTAGPNTTVGSLASRIEFTTHFTGLGTATITARGCVQSAVRPEPRCTQLSASVEVEVGPMPRITSLSCAPELVAPRDPVSCRAAVENDPDSLAWFASGGEPERGTALDFETRFTSVGGASILLRACVTGLGEPRCDEATTVVRVAEGARPPRIRTPGCAPDLVPVGQVISCSPEVTGGQSRFTWTAGPDASSAQGSGQRFGTSFSMPGTKTITLRVCVDRPGRPEECDEVGQPITVTATAPGIEAVTCSPATVEAGKPVTCSARTAGATPASWTWSADGGSPAAGASPTFTTSFPMAGRYAVRVSACVSDRCGTGETAVTVTARGPVTLTGQFTLNQADGGNCNPTFSPVTNGTISLQITYPENPNEPARVTGSLNGGGRGSVSWRCDGQTGSAAWSQSYQVANFTGTLDRTTGAIIAITGTLTGSRTVSHNNCRRDGRMEACPSGDNNSYSFPVRLTGTLRETSGGGTLFVDRIGLATSGPWSVR